MKECENGNDDACQENSTMLDETASDDMLTKTKLLKPMSPNANEAHREEEDNELEKWLKEEGASDYSKEIVQIYGDRSIKSLGSMKNFIESFLQTDKILASRCLLRREKMKWKEANDLKLAVELLTIPLQVVFFESSSELLGTKLRT